MKCSLSIIHGAHLPGRADMLSRLNKSLGPFPPWVIRARVFYETEPPRDPTVGYGWASRSWEWAAQTGCEFNLFLNDDVIPAPGFWSILEAMLPHVPLGVALGLATVSPAQKEWADRGNRWLTDGHGIVGWGYGLWYDEMTYLSAVERALPKEHRSPHSHDECPADCPWWHEDSWLTMMLETLEVPIWHPIPSILDHDISVKSAFGNDHHKCRTAPVKWDFYDLGTLTDKEFWRP